MSTTLLLCAAIVTTQPLDPRYCGPPLRLSSGKIYRNPDVIVQFRRAHPCPSTGRRSGPCPGWAVDHVIPLASCGCDAMLNLQWLPVATKSARGALAKDRWERRVYRCPK